MNLLKLIVIIKSLNLSGQAVQLEIHLSRLIGVDRLVQAGKCLLYNANQYSLMLYDIVKPTS